MEPLDASPNAPPELSSASPHADLVTQLAEAVQLPLKIALSALMASINQTVSAFQLAHQTPRRD
jgi:hypothetical protein